ncbi:GNAT family N-acetyltransferase [Vallitalea okinawensis]|uniref:GNAT family N-acetyltransferase n=1 Tax=Vallitalea okinawensis TaxID=2078660 RepID=UPI000CFE1AB4|nr:GNAT family N-acetyltransferase [Vallitalea okinawensis]
MLNKYEFESERLGFRQWDEKDKEPFYMMNSNNEVMRFFPNTLLREESNKFVDKIMKHFEEKGYGLWAVEVKKTNEFIGFIGFKEATFEAAFTPCIEIGWRLDNKHWNRGYATEGARACLKYAFNQLKLNDIYSFTAQINHPSINVMSKIGLREVGTFNHPKVAEDSPLRPHVLYKIDRAMYKHN